MTLRRTSPGRFVMSVAAAVGFLAASCDSNGTATIPTTPPGPPSAVISSVLDAAQSTFCKHVGDLQRALADLQASPTPDVAAAASALDTLASNLRSDADQLRSSGHDDLAAAATGLAGAVDSLRGLATSTTLASGFDTGLAVVGTLLAQLPQDLCPGGNPSP